MNKITTKRYLNKKNKLRVKAVPHKISTLEINPFTDEYVKQEVKFYGLTDYNENGILIKSINVLGRCDDFLNVNFRIGNLVCPQFFIDNKLWMSLTPMEIQSHYLPIQNAKGNIAIGGLGMGYCLLRVMEKDVVKSIDVYEIEKRAVDFFIKNFHKRKGFDKITFIIGDARKEMKDKKYEFVYMDIYPAILPNDVILDKKLFLKNNAIKEYHFWCQEKVFKAGYEAGDVGLLELPSEVLHLFKMWSQTDNAKLRDHDLDPDFVNECLMTFNFDF